MKSMRYVISFIYLTSLFCAKLFARVKYILNRKRSLLFIFTSLLILFQVAPSSAQFNYNFSLLAGAENKDPVAVDETIYVAKNGNSGQVAVMSNDSDPDSDPLVIDSITQGTNGAVVDNGNGTVTYTPNASYTGLDTFTYTISDGRGGTDTATVTVKVVAPFTWTGLASADDSWSAGSNWCGTVTAGACVGAAGAPTATDVAIFDETCTNCNADVNVNANIQGLDIKSGYTGTITQLAGQTITVGSSYWMQAGGTFVGGDSLIDVKEFTLSGGSFTSTSGMMAVGTSPGWNTNNTDGFTITGGTYNHNNGTIKFDGTGTYYSVCHITATGGVTFNHVEFAPADSDAYPNSNNTDIEIDAATTITVLGDMTISDGHLVGGNIDLKGNLSLTYTNANIRADEQPLPDPTVVTFSNNTPQTYSSNNATNRGPSLTINTTSTVSPAGGTTDFALADLRITQGTFTAPTGTLGIGALAPWAGDNTEGMIITGGSFVHNGGTVLFDGVSDSRAAATVTAAGGITFNHLKIDVEDNANPSPRDGTSVKLSAGTNLTILGDLTISDGKLYGGSAELKGDLYLVYTDVDHHAEPIYANSGTDVTLNANVPQTLNSDNIVNKGPNLIIDTSSTVTVATANYGISEFTLTNGTFTAASGTMLVGGAADWGSQNSDGFIITGGTFNHNNGFIKFDGSGASNTTTYVNSSIPLDLNDVEIAVQDVDGQKKEVDIEFDAGLDLTILGDLTISDGYMRGGEVKVEGNVEFQYTSNEVQAETDGTTTLTMQGASDATVNFQASSEGHSGPIQVNKSGGAKVTLLSAALFNTAGQDLSILDGTLDMAGFDLTVNDQLNVGDGVGAASSAKLISNCGTITAGTTTTNPTDGEIVNSGNNPNITINDVSATEGTALDFTVTLSEAYCLGNLTIDYASSNGTATLANSDYTNTNGTGFTFTPGQLTKTISVPTTTDTTYELDETLTMTISNNNVGTITDAAGTGTILNDDINPFTWTGLAGDGLWTTAGNWQGSAVPGAGDIATFDGTCTNCAANIDANISVLGLELKSTYTGTLTQQAGNTITIGTIGWLQSGGTFVGGDSDITINKAFELTGGTFTSTTAQLNVLSNITISNPSYFTHNSGTLRTFGCMSGTYSMDNLVLYNFIQNKASCGTPVFGGTINISNDLTINSSQPFQDGNLLVSGNVDIGNNYAYSTNTSWIKMVGTGNQTINADGIGAGSYNHDFANLEVNKPSGTLTFTGSVSFAGHLTYVAGTVDMGSVDFTFVGCHNSTINSGPIEFNNVTFNKSGCGTQTITGTMIINGNLDWLGVSSHSGGEIQVKGDVVFNGGTSNSTTAMTFNGSSKQTITHTSGFIPSGLFTINNVAGVELASNVTLTGGGQDLHLVSGDLNLAGFDLTIPDVLTLEAGTNIYTNCGALTYNSLVNNGGNIVNSGNNPNITINDVSATEGTALDFVVTLSEGYCLGNLTLDYASSNGTATLANSDYTNTNGTGFTFTPGQLTKTISVPTTTDTTYELDETLNMTISNNNVGTITDAAGVGTILNDDTNPFTWTGLAGDGLWTTAGNWQGSAVPGAGDIATFDGTCTNCAANIDANISVLGLELKSTYTGTLTQQAGNTITVGSIGWLQSGGTFVGGNSSITAAGNMSISSGTFTATSATIWARKDFIAGAGITFNHNNGNLSLGDTVSLNFDPQGISLYDFTVSQNSGAYVYIYMLSDVTVLNDMTILPSSKDNNIKGSSYTITLHGDLIATGHDGTNSAAGAWIKLVGTNHSITVGSGPYHDIQNIEFAHSGTVSFIGDTVKFVDNIKHTSGTIDTTGVKVEFAALSNVTYDFNNGPFTVVGDADFLANGGCYCDNVINGTIIVNGNALFNMGAGDKLSTGTIEVKGDLTVSDLDSGNALIKLTGTNQTVVGAANGHFPNFEIASTGNVDIQGVMALANGFTYTSGTVTMTSSTLNIDYATNYISNSTIDSGPIEWNDVNILKGTSAPMHVNVTGTMIIKGDLTVNSYAYSQINTGTIELHGDYNQVAGGDLGSPKGTAGISFVGSTNQTINYTAGQLPNGLVTVNKPSGKIIQNGNLDLDNGGSQDLHLVAGSWDMAGFDLSIDDALTLETAPAQTYLFTACGTLTVNGVTTDPGSGIIGATGFPNVTITGASGDEGTNLDFTVSLDGYVCGSNFTVNYTTNDSIATLADSDYTDNDNTLTITPGNLTGTITVVTTSDANLEIDEEFNVVLNTPSHGLLAVDTGIGTILNDDDNGYIWTGDSGNNDWSTAGNWSGNAVPPTDGSVVVLFDDICNDVPANCNASTAGNINVKGLLFNSNYTGTLTQSAGNTVTVGDKYFYQAGGSFAGGDSAISTEKYWLLGGTFTATSGIFSVGYYKSSSTSNTDGFIVWTGSTFNHNSGTLKFMGSQYTATVHNSTSITVVDVPTSLTLNNMVVDIGSTAYSSASYAKTHLKITDGDTLVVNGDLTIEDGSINNGLIDLKGNLIAHCVDGEGADHCAGDREIPASFNGRFGGGTTEIVFSGNVPQTYDFDVGARVPFVTINTTSTVSAAAGTTFSTDGFKLLNGTFNAPTGVMSIGYRGSYNEDNNTTGFVVSGGTFNHNSGTLNLDHVGVEGSFPAYHMLVDVPASITVNNLTVSLTDINSGNGYDGSKLLIAAGDTLNVGGTFTLKDGVLDGGTILAMGDIDATATDVNVRLEGGTTTLKVNGTAPQTVTASTGALFGNLEIDSSSTVTFSGDFSVQTDFKYTAGTVTDLANTVTFSSNLHSIITPGAIKFNNVIFNKDNNSADATVSGTMDIDGNLTINNPDIDTNLYGGTINLAGNLDVLDNGEHTVGLVAIVFDGTTDQMVNHVAGHFPKGGITVNKSSGDVIQTSNVTMLSSTNDLNIISGDWDMARYDLSIEGDLSLTNTPQTYLYKRCGALTVTGTTTDPGGGITGNGQPTITISDESEPEGTSLAFTVTMSHQCDTATTVNYTTNDGTATTADSDYTDNDSSIVIPANTSTGTITIVTGNDSNMELTEDLTVVVTSTNWGDDVSTATGTGTILNDDDNGFIWVGDVDNDMSKGTNWSNNVNPPGASDIVMFDGSCSTCTPATNGNFSVAGMWLGPDFTGTITQSSGDSITVGSSNFDMNGGTLNGGDSNITVNDGYFRLRGGSFTSTTATLDLAAVGNNDFAIMQISNAADFVHNSGTLRLANSYSCGGGCSSVFDTRLEVQAGALILNHLTVEITDSSSAGGYDELYLNLIVASDITVNGDLILDDGSFYGGNINVKGDIYANCADGASGSRCTMRGKTGKITFNGAGAQMIYAQTGAGLPIVWINNSSTTSVTAGVDIGMSELRILNGSTFTSTSGTLSVGYHIGNTFDSNTDGFVVDAGGVFNHNSGTVHFVGVVNSSSSAVKPTVIDVDSSLTLNNVIVDIDNTSSSRYAVLGIAAGDILNIIGDFTWNNGQISAGTLNLSGSTLAINCPDGANNNCALGGTANITYSGSGAQSLTSVAGSVMPGGAIIVNKSAGTLTHNSEISYNSAGQDYHIQGGTVDMNGLDLTINDALTLDSGTVLNQSSGVLTYGGTLTNNGTINP